MASLESQSHFQQNRPEIFQADVRHVSCGFDDDKNLARGMVYRRWIFAFRILFGPFVMIALPDCIVWLDSFMGYL